MEVWRFCGEAAKTPNLHFYAFSPLAVQGGGSLAGKLPSTVLSTYCSRCVHAILSDRVDASFGLLTRLGWRRCLICAPIGHNTVYCTTFLETFSYLFSLLWICLNNDQRIATLNSLLIGVRQVMGKARLLHGILHILFYITGTCDQGNIVFWPAYPAFSSCFTAC